MKLPGQSKKSFKLEHAYDDHQYTNGSSHPYNNGDDMSISTITGGSDPPPYIDDPYAKVFETPQEKKLRKRSHMVAYATMFVITVGFSVVVTGVWPYLQELDDSLTKASLGWVIAANPLGQLIASPIVGYIGGRIGSIRIICYVTMTFFVIGNLMYSFLPLTMSWGQHAPFYMMIFTRFIVGLSSSNVTLCRSYLAASTTVKERTIGIALVSAAQATGYVLGPAIQTVLSLLIDENMMKYRSTGWVAAALGVFNMFLLTPFIFQEYDIAEKERAMLAAKNKKAGLDFVLPAPDYLGIVAVMFAFFMNQFIYVLLEALFEAFVSDQYAWCDEFAVIVVGVSLSIGGVLTIPMFIVAARLARKLDERKILIFMAFVPISIGVFLFQPWTNKELIYCGIDNYTTPFMDTTLVPPNPPALMYFDENNNDPLFLSDDSIVQSRHLLYNYDPDNPYNHGVDNGTFCAGDECYGCPIEQKWCEGYPQLPIQQFYVAFFIVILGYPFGVSMSNAIMSKMLGPNPQGLWMGILTASGSFARVMGPIFVAQVYTKLGTRWTFGTLFVGMLLAITELRIMFKRLVPMKIEDLSEVGKV